MSEIKIQPGDLLALQSIITTQHEDLETQLHQVSTNYSQATESSVWQRVAKSSFLSGATALDVLLKGNISDYTELEKQLAYMSQEYEELDQSLASSIG